MSVLAILYNSLLRVEYMSHTLKEKINKGLQKIVRVDVSGTKSIWLLKNNDDTISDTTPRNSDGSRMKK